MDLNDTFTETLLQRSKARKEYLNAKMNDTSNTIGRKRTILDDATILEDSSKRQRLDCPTESEKENAHNGLNNVQDAFVPFKVSSSIRGLAALRKTDSTGVSKDAKTTSDSIEDSKVNKYEIPASSNNISRLCSTQQTRLANLAAQINQWEDDLPQPTQASNHITSSLSKKANTSSESKDILFPIPTNALSEEIEHCHSEPILLKGESIRRENFTSVNKSNFCQNYSEKPSHFSFELSKITEPASLPLSARKAFFEKAATLHNVKPNEHTFQPKLSVAQRTAMFEKAARTQQIKPQVNLALPKRFVTTAPIKTSKVDVQQSHQESSCEKQIATSEVQFSDSPVQEMVPLTDVDSKLLTSEDISPDVSLVEQQSAGNITSPLQKQNLEDAAFKSQQQIESNAQEITQKSMSSHLEQSHLESAILNTEQLVEDVASKEDQTSVENFPSDSMPRCVESSDSQQLLVENILTNSQQGEVVPKLVQGKEISNLVNHWEKLSSSTSVGNSNSEEDLSARQSEMSSINAYESEEEHAEYESELEWDEEESISECNEGLIPECKAEESANYSIVSDFGDEAMEQEVFNPATFSADAGLSNFDVETDSFPATDDETNSYNGQNWQQQVNNPNSFDNASLISTTMSESSSCNASSFTPQISESQTCSSSGSIGINEVEESSVKEEKTIIGSSSSVDSPLVHTVSFYRKQKLGSRSSPMLAIKRPRSPAEDDNPTLRIQQQIKLLQEEIVRQQNVIGQTSQALNLCHSTAEFSGSSEQVEAERLLLIATQKRQACMNEIQGLKSKSVQGEQVIDGSGTLIITDLQLPLKRDFIASQLKGEISTVHCFLCLIRQGAQVIVSQMLSTSDKITDGALCFSNHIKLQNLPPDFSVVFEVYTLKTSKENLPHDKKYHIKREHSKIRLNSKGKKTDSRLLLPAISSPGGPNAVRSPSFSVIGYTRFTVQNCSKKCFTLDEVPFTSPLEGILKVKLHLHAENNTAEKGFLTMFEDVSGYGHWTRLWCSLESHQLAYWKYPDDEHRKKPIDTIDLRQCVTGQVKQVSRDICARPNTFRLVTVRPLKEGDRNTLVSQSVNTLTTTRHLLSADTKGERIVWCNKLNEALANVRKWDARALRPEEDNDN